MARLTVYLDERMFALVPGSEVSDLIACLPPDEQLALANGDAILADQHDNEIGSGGGLAEGQRLSFVRLT